MRAKGRLFLSFLRSVIDFFYPLFRRLMSLQFYRYGVVGSISLVFDWVLYFVIFHFLLEKNNLEFSFITISSHIATLGIKFPIALLFGFVLQKYITFSSSEVPGKTQLFRYALLVLFNLIFSYFGLKLCVEYFLIYPTPSNMIVSVLTIFISYFSQKHFTFKTTIS